MILILLNKLLVLGLVMSCLNTIRHLYYFIQTFIQSTEEEPVKYLLSTQSLVMLGLSISYILTIIFTGIKML